ncbi:MAG TPA: DUF6580 family putative transport protein [Sphingomicrobium sp.]|nr:DUF6580 family putative transport protein [Sphingomicrobium sp.]
MLTPRLIAIILAVFAAALFRILPHPPNFSPIAAMALFSGALLGRRALAFVAPLGAMLLSDMVLGFHAGMPFVYGSVALIVALGWLLSSSRTAARLALAAAASSVLFYLVTNFGVWAIGDMYPNTAAGLLACYVAAIPFFQNSLAGDLFFTALLFGGFALAERWLPVLRQAPELRTA